MIYITRNNPRALLRLIAEQQDKIYVLENQQFNIIQYCKDKIEEVEEHPLFLDNEYLQGKLQAYQDILQKLEKGE